MDEDQKYKEQLQQLKTQLLPKILEKKARERLNLVRIAHPQLAEKIELTLIQAAQAGQIQEKVDDEKLKDILKRIQEEKQSFRILKWDQ
jgi:programmed cell death protein 5